MNRCGMCSKQLPVRTHEVNMATLAVQSGKYHRVMPMIPCKEVPVRTPVANFKDRLLMALSPLHVLIAVVAISGICVLGITHANDSLAGQIIGFCSLSVIAMLGMLKGEGAAKSIEQKIDAKSHSITTKLDDNTRKTEAVNEKVETVVQQTNGNLTNKLDDIKGKVEAVANDVKQATVEIKKSSDSHHG